MRGLLESASSPAAAGENLHREMANEMLAHLAEWEEAEAELAAKRSRRVIGRSTKTSVHRRDKLRLRLEDRDQVDIISCRR